MQRKELGQHWLFDSAILQDIARTAGVEKADTILEVGPGLGTLTKVLLAHGAEVTAVEFDKELYDQLREDAAHSQDSKRLHIMNQDILKFDLNQLPADYKVVANIPYYLTGKLLRLLTGTTNPPRSMTQLVQKEVAVRLAARPGQLSIIAVSVQLFGDVALGSVVPAEAFTPPPKVDSQIIYIKRRDAPLFPDLDHKSFFRMVRAGFGEKRKKLRSSLAGGLHLDKTRADEWLKAAGIPPDARAQALSLEGWYRLWQTPPS